MKAPNFWKKRNFFAYLLLPLSYFYVFIGFLRNLNIKPTKVTTPIICIGNLNVGGAGKTPIAIKLGQILNDLKIDFAYLGHGYKSKITENEIILVDKNNKNQVGDEAILLDEINDVIIAKNRVLAAQEITKVKHKKLIIMDDGLQNPSLQKDYKILVIDGNYAFGNEFILPAGPLRQKINDGIKEINLIIIIGEDKFNLKDRFKDKKVIFGEIKVKNKAKSTKKDVIAFCGIGQPEKFFNSLKESNYNLIKEISFSDHYHYTQKDIANLIQLSLNNDANLITTKKDWVKLSAEDKEKIEFLDIEVIFKKADEKYIKEELLNLC